MSIIDEYIAICNQVAEAEANPNEIVGASKFTALIAEKKSMKEVLMNRYRVVLSTLCGYLGIINRYTDLYESGKVPNNQVLAELTIRLAALKEELISLKTVLEIPGELTFMEDNCFDGFEIKAGRFIGQKDNVKLILRKWLEGFPETANAYQYEVAVFVYFLAFPESFDNAQSATRISPFKLLGRRFQNWQQTLSIKFAS